MKIATWNVNSLRIRLDHVTRWLDAHQPDVLCLQETKVPDEHFPLDTFAERGYFAAFHGQKSYNGVAILARWKPADVVLGFDGHIHNDQMRVLTATLGDTRVTSVYVPNGADLKSEKFVFKREFFQHLIAFATAQAKKYPRYVICGDFNISHDERDVDDAARRAKQVMFTPDERAWLGTFMQQAGLADAFRQVNPQAGVFSWWDYRMWSLKPFKFGMRIDYLFASAALAPKIQAVEHFAAEREQSQPSDHIPILLTLEG
jgi:exodeoxyribonuclease-3